MVNRVVVGAHYGLRGWIVQRLSAIIMTLYLLLFAGVLILQRPSEYNAWRAVFAGQAMKLATLLFVLSLIAHSWVGMRDILMDYARPTSLRFALEAIVAVLLLAWAGWAVQILWSL